MSGMSWKSELQMRLLRVRENDLNPRVAVIGVGNALCGDDAAGSLLIRLLQPHLDDHGQTLLVSAGTSPESCTGLLRRFKPRLVVLVDAAQLDCEPGAIRWIPGHRIKGLSASTHTLPLDLLASFLEAELGCEVAMLGIQPVHCEFGPMSSVVRSRVTDLARVLAEALGGLSPPATGLRLSSSATPKQEYNHNPGAFRHPEPE